MYIAFIVVRYEVLTSISCSFAFDLNWFGEFSNSLYFEVKIFENPTMDVWTCCWECSEELIGLGGHLA